jgi:hypothetical protein
MDAQTLEHVETQPAPKYLVGLIEPRHYEQLWPQIGPMLEDVAATMSDHDLQTLVGALVDPNIRFYTFGIVKDRKVAALVGVELLETATKDRHLHINFVTGQNPERWIGYAEDHILDWARGFGCTKATGMFRKAFLKMLPDWTYTRHIWLERDL